MIVLCSVKQVPTLHWDGTIRCVIKLELECIFNSSFGAKRLNALRFAMNSMIGNSRMFTDADF